MIQYTVTAAVSKRACLEPKQHQEIKPMALTIVELSEGISKSVSRNPAKQENFKFYKILLEGLMWGQHFLGLVMPNQINIVKQLQRKGEAGYFWVIFCGARKA